MPTLTVGAALALLYSTILFAVYAASTATVGALLGLRIVDISLFVGPKIFRVHLFGIPLTMRLIPIGSSVRFRGDENEKNDSHGPADELMIDDLSIVKRTLFTLTGCASLMVIAFICLGVPEAVHQLRTGFPQVVIGALGRKPNLARAYFELAANVSCRHALGLLATKLAAINLLPLPPNAGGMVLEAMLPIAIREKLRAITFPIFLTMALLWLTTFWSALTS
jgi:membrane-associated protease RseP (regulator of RpoE activity)